MLVSSMWLVSVRDSHNTTIILDTATLAAPYGSLEKLLSTRLIRKHAYHIYFWPIFDVDMLDESDAKTIVRSLCRVIEHLHKDYHTDHGNIKASVTSFLFSRAIDLQYSRTS